MKPFGSFTKSVAYGATLMALLSLCSVTQAADGKATVSRVVGNAEYSEKPGSWQTLSSGKVLGSGASVRTAGKSQVDLFLGNNGTSVRLIENTTLGLDKLSLSGSGVDVVVETMLDLRTGTIRGSVQQLAAGSKYEVKTPRTVFAINAVKGPTEYQISADGTHHVIEGSGVVAYNQQNRITPFTVNQGQTFVPPVDPTGPTPPTIVPLQKGNIIERPVVVVTPPPVVAVPEPVQFVSPGSGSR